MDGNHGIERKAFSKMNSASSMATVNSSEMELGSHFDNIGEDSVTRMVQFSVDAHEAEVSIAAQREQVPELAESASSAVPQPSDSSFEDKANNLLLQANQDGSLQQDLQSGQASELDAFPDEPQDKVMVETLQQIPAEAGRPGEGEVKSEALRLKAKRDLLGAAKNGELGKSLRARCIRKTKQDPVDCTLLPLTSPAEELQIETVAESSSGPLQMSPIEDQTAGGEKVPSGRVKAKAQMLEACKDGRLGVALQKARPSPATGQVEPPLQEAEAGSLPAAMPSPATEPVEPPSQGVEAESLPAAVNLEYAEDPFPLLDDARKTELDSPPAMVPVVDDDSTGKYTRDSTWIESATSEGREQQSWAASVLGTLARETPKFKRKTKLPLKRQSTHSIIRELGCATALMASASSPSIAANSILGQQSSNSVRSQLTSQADSDGMYRNTWTPPSPPAPSSVRTERTDHSQQRVPSLLLGGPATGLHLSPCSSATSQKALEANLARSVVPGLDLTSVHMGYDEDEETEDDATGNGVQAFGTPSLQASDDVRKADVPQLDMSSLQFDAAGSSALSKLTRSSGSRKVQAPREELIRPISRGGSTGDLRPVIPGPKDISAFQAAPAQSNSGVRRMPGYMMAYPASQTAAYPASQATSQYGFTVNVDTAGSIVAGIERKMALDAPVGVRLPPVNTKKQEAPKAKKSTAVSHVHMHHHLHYHVKRPAAESDLNP